MSSKEWTRFAQQSLSRRIHGAKFQSLASVLRQQCPAPGAQIAKAILVSRQTSQTPSDPLIPRFINVLLLNGFIRIPDILSNLLQIWEAYDHRDSERDQWNGSQLLEAVESDRRVVEEILIAIPTGKATLTIAEATSSLYLLSDWLLVIIDWATKDAETREPRGSWPPSLAAFFEAVGFLLASIVQHEHGALAVTDATTKGNEISSSDWYCPSTIDTLDSSAGTFEQAIDFLYYFYGHCISSPSRQIGSNPEAIWLVRGDEFQSTRGHHDGRRQPGSTPIRVKCHGRSSHPLKSRALRVSQRICEHCSPPSLGLS